MKIKMTTTEIEADARELRESNTMAENLSRLVARMFQSHETFDEDEEEDEEEED